MIYSDELVDFVKGWEFLSLIAYPDGAGVWTIGWGHTRHVKQGDTCDRAMATAYLLNDLIAVEKELAGFITRTGYQQQQYDALCTLGFNVGVTGPHKVGESFTMWLFNAGRDTECADRFLRWNMSGGVPVRGLSRRRAAERDIYLHGDYSGRP